MSISAKTKNAFCICWLLIITQTYSQQQNSTNTSNQTQKYQVFGSNYLYQVNQNLSAQTFQLSLSNSYFSQRYIVIDIIILSKQDSQFQFISCLNYNQDPLQQDSFVNQGQYNCSFTDQVAQQQNLAQQLLIIDTSDPSYQQNNTIYLTVLYQSTNSIQKASLIPLPQPINYDVYVYYYSKVPCHSSCNGLNGYCNDQTGVCSCNQFYTGADCGLYLNPLNIQNDKDSTYITIQPRSQYTFSINMTNIIQKAQGQNIQFSLKKIYGASNLNIYMLFNQNQQPSPDQYQMYYSMANSYMNISNVDSLCSQFQNSTNSLSNNSQQPQSNQCFIVFNMQQLSNSKLSIIVNFGINILANTTTNSATSNSTQNNINNNTNLRDPKSITGNNSGSNSTYSTSLTTDVQSKYQAYEITIYVLVGLAFIFVAFLLLFTVCRRCQKMLESRYLSQQTQLDQSVLAESALDKVSQEETQKQKRKNQKDNLQLQDLETNLNKSVQLNTSLNSSKQCCSICLIEFVPQEKVQKTICSHTFHIECIQDWIQKNDNCPLCRQSFDILDMIDYLAKEKLAQAENKDQQLAIIQNKNKIEDILLTQKEQIIQFTDDDFLTIFKFFKIDKELIIQKQPKQQNAQPVANTQSDKITKDEKAFKLEESNALLNQNYDQVTCLSPTYLSTLSSPVSKFQSVYVQQQLIQSPTAELPQHSQNPSIFTLQKFSQNQQELNAQNNQKNTHKSIDNIPEEVSYPIQNQNYFSSKSQVFTKKTLNLKNKNSITHNHLKMQDENQNQYQNFANNEEQKDEQNQEYSENQNNFSSFQNQTGNQKIFTSQKS